MTDMELYLKTNPVFTTAESCLVLISMTGDPDAVKMRDELGLSLDMHGGSVPEEMRAKIIEALPGLVAGMESRFETHNNFIDASGIGTIVDLPCGFEPRGPRYARQGKNYYGFDLPAVIGRVGDAAKKVTEPEYRDYLHYSPVDATNYDSLRNALKDVEGEILITTEGLLMYFTDSELKTVLQNIAALLSEFGGCWVTFDRDSHAHTAACLQGVLGDAAARAMSSVSGAAGKMSDFSTSKNFLFTGDEETVLRAMDEAGLTVEKVPFTEYSADLKILKTRPEGAMVRVNSMLGGVNLWVMRAKPAETKHYSTTVGEAEIVCRNENGSMELSLSGRLDSLNAPELLAEFQRLEETQRIQRVAVDMNQLGYISSAGLRTLLLIYKEVGGQFRINGCSEAVREIMDMTGFSDAFGMSD